MNRDFCVILWFRHHCAITKSGRGKGDKGIRKEVNWVILSRLASHHTWLDPSNRHPLAPGCKILCVQPCMALWSLLKSCQSAFFIPPCKIEEWVRSKIRERSENLVNFYWFFSPLYMPRHCPFSRRNGKSNNTAYWLCTTLGLVFFNLLL